MEQVGKDHNYSISCSDNLWSMDHNRSTEGRLRLSGDAREGIEKRGRVRDGYWFSVASRTTRAAAWLASSEGCSISRPTTGTPGCMFRQWVRKFASTLFNSVTVGFSAMRPRENTSRQSEQYHTNGVLVRSTKDTGINVAMQTVSHSAVPPATPVEIKRHHYRHLQLARKRRHRQTSRLRD